MSHQLPQPIVPQDPDHPERTRGPSFGEWAQEAKAKATAFMHTGVIPDEHNVSGKPGQEHHDALVTAHRHPEVYLEKDPEKRKEIEKRVAAEEAALKPQRMREDLLAPAPNSLSTYEKDGQ